ncbi:hypothetical protein ES705_01826 [subsurface metagenome]|nr:hypothetical protein [Clostridia bacterium]
MENSIFLAKLLGPYCIIVAVGILFNLRTYQKVMGDFCKNSALIYLGGVMALFFGLLIVLFHNVWVANWVVIITIFGWLGFIKGAWLIILPNTVAKLTEAYQKNVALLVVHLVIILALGVFLTVMGYFVV